MKKSNYKETIKTKWNNLLGMKVTFSQLFLTLLYTTIILASNIIAVKLIKLPFNFLGIDYITCAVVVYPLTIILSDIFTEVFHYKYSRITCYLAFLMNLVVVGIFGIMTVIPKGGYFQFDLNAGAELAGFESLILDTWYMLLASFIAFLIGDFLNDFVFAKMKGDNKTTKGYNIRAVVSTAVAQIIDASIFFILGFGLFKIIFEGAPWSLSGPGYFGMSWANIFAMILLQFIIKVVYEIILLPVTKPLVNSLDKLQKKLTEEPEVINKEEVKIETKEITEDTTKEVEVIKEEKKEEVKPVEQKKEVTTKNTNTRKKNNSNKTKKD